jgi:hypothetical protein
MLIWLGRAMFAGTQRKSPAFTGFAFVSTAVPSRTLILGDPRARTPSFSDGNRLVKILGASQDRAEATIYESGPRFGHFVG